MLYQSFKSSLIRIIPIWDRVAIFFFQAPGEVEEVLGSVHFVVEVLWVVDDQAEFHVLAEVDAIEVVVPDAAVGRDHEEAQELVGEDDLNSFIACWTVAFRVWSAFFVCFGPVETILSQLVDGERARALSEATCSNNARVSVPILAIVKKFGVHRRIERRQLARLARLSMNPP